MNFSLKKKKSMVTYLKTVIYIQDTSCAGFESVAGNPGHLYRFLVSFCALRVQFVRPTVFGNSPDGDGEEAGGRGGWDETGG